jgi:hypothetical protein
LPVFNLRQCLKLFSPQLKSVCKFFIFHRGVTRVPQNPHVYKDQPQINWFTKLPDLNGREDTMHLHVSPARTIFKHNLRKNTKNKGAHAHHDHRPRPYWTQHMVGGRRAMKNPGGEPMCLSGKAHKGKKFAATEERSRIACMRISHHTARLVT